MIQIIQIIISYLLGSISGSMVMGKFKKVDIRNMGSGNAGGKNAFNYRKFKEIKNQKELLLEDQKKTTRTEVANAWSSYQSSKSVLDSIRYQVKAAEIANEGITLEYESGTSRTTLEVIQSRSILLNSRINLASSERNFLISQFNLLVAVGRLTAKHLNL